jgi:hypothetical protein
MASKRDIPFRYPKSRHSRRLQPRHYTRYGSFKKYLRIEFEQKCIYCRRPDSVHPNDHKSFAVEHYRPKDRFEDLTCDYHNLFYACSMCNSYKGEYWPQSDDEPFFPNPCDHVMMDHVRFVDCMVEAKSKHGAFMRDALRLNDETLVSWRKSAVHIIRSFEKEIAELKSLKIKLRKRINRGEQDLDLGRDIEKIAGEIVDHLATLDRFCGTTLTPLNPNPNS